MAGVSKFEDAWGYKAMVGGGIGRGRKNGELLENEIIEVSATHFVARYKIENNGT